MKITAYLLALLVFLGLLSCNKGGCIEHEKLPCEVIDINPNYVDPVCDCHGNTYQNEAIIQCMEGKTKYKKGKCK